MTKHIANIRREYLGKPLSKKEIHPNPLAQFNQWLEEAINAEIPEPTAMTLSTANTRGQVNSRIVLLKEVEENGFIFYTNYKSRKGQDLAENPFASMTFFWAELFRQIRIEGTTEKVSPKKSDEYFNSRPEDSKISALVSEQSQEIPDRKYLESQFETLKKKYNNQQITRPEHWGGYILYPDKIEFWQGRLNRLHDRIQYEKISNHWKIRRLAP
ncbi:MAG: pyridoxamine 5'-phosphate oxidase [Bacteroidales bacterium]